MNERALAVKIDGKNIGEVSEMSIGDALPFFKGLTFSEQKEQIAKPILKEICDRLSFLVNVGLAYLTLSRSARTLSGGEAQRIRLATQIGSISDLVPEVTAERSWQAVRPNRWLVLPSH